MNEPNKIAFQTTWPGGYGENWTVYEQKTGCKEQDLVSACLSPFYDGMATCLEIGCGSGFWINKYLLPHFKSVIGIDVIPGTWVNVQSNRFTYHEVPNRNYDCFGVNDCSVDFVWSFGCFCHIPIPAIEQYLKSIVRVMKPGAKCSLYFSNTERRPGTASNPATTYNPDKEILWTENNWSITQNMMVSAGLTNVKDLMPQHIDTMAYGEKPIASPCCQ